LNGHYNLGKNQFRNKGGKPSGRKGIPSPLKGKPNGKKGIPTGPNGKKGVPSKKKGKTYGPSGRKGKTYGPNGRKGMPSKKKGKTYGPTGKQQNPAPEVECPHCGTIGKSNVMKRRHFDNCKKKPL
jgi:hypothetical protein